jgi:anti-sigma factor RsiW
MLCKNNIIKDLLPEYVADALNEADLLRVKDHLTACADCAQEAALLRMMAGEPAPDPGEAFWAGMPARVYRAVREQEKKGLQHRLLGLLHGAILPRWAWAAAAVGIVLIISWSVINPGARRDVGLPGSGDEYSYDDASNHDPVLRHTSTTIAELTSPELEAVDSWAAEALSSLAFEAGANETNIFDADLSEELAELNAPEVDRLSTMLNDLVEEG